MKKLMSLMLGLTLLVGTTALFGDAPPKKEGKPASTKTTKGKKSGKKSKKTDTTSTEKKS